MARTSEKDLNGLVNRLNRITNSPMAAYTEDANGKFRANIGNYRLDYAYGGVKLVRMHNEMGGVSTPLYMGYETKRTAYNLIAAFIAGIESVNQGERNGQVLR